MISVGQHVAPKNDPRHVGRIIAIKQDFAIIVRWKESDWIEECGLHDLEIIKPGDERL